MWDFVCRETGNPLLVHFLARLIRVAGVRPRDPTQLARAVQLYSARKIKFFRERPERFQAPLRTVVWGLGDCDDKAIFVACCLRTFRVPIRLKFIRITHKVTGGKLGHVYPVAHLEGAWRALDSVREYPLGYDPEKRAKERGYEVETQIIGDSAENPYL